VGAWAEESLFGEGSATEVGQPVALGWFVSSVAYDSEPGELAVWQAFEHQVGMGLASDPARRRLLVHRFCLLAPFGTVRFGGWGVLTTPQPLSTFVRCLGAFGDFAAHHPFHVVERSV
jgi:hypothetical protein